MLVSLMKKHQGHFYIKIITEIFQGNITWTLSMSVWLECAQINVRFSAAKDLDT